MVRLALLVGATLAALVAPAQAYLYWTVAGPASLTSAGGTAIGRADLDGSGVTHSLITGLGNPNAIAIDAAHIYWINASTASIGRANLDGSGANPTWIQPSRAPEALAVDASHIYWTDGSWHVGRANLDGTAADSNWLPTSPAATGVQGIAVTSTTLYVGAAGQIASMPLPIGSGSLTTLTLLPANDQATAMTVANGYLYWVSDDLVDPQPASAIDRIQLTGAHTVNLNYIPNLYFPFGVATDGTYLYWTDDQPGLVQIGRALISSGAGATNIDYSFVSEQGGPGGIAVDARIDPTSTKLSCTPAAMAAGSPTTCAVTVTDTASASVPTGTINLTGNGAAFFSGNPCTLTPLPSGAASCVVGAVPTTAGNQGLHAAYSGDPVHSPSAGDLTICAGSGCTPTPTPAPTPTPKPKPPCVVPKLKGKTLAQARTLLRKGNCALGKVTRPKARKGHPLGPLVVGTQSSAAGRKLGNGSKVNLRLIRAPKRRHS